MANVSGLFGRDIRDGSCRRAPRVELGGRAVGVDLYGVLQG